MAKQSMSVSAGKPAGHAHNIEAEYRKQLDNIDAERTVLNETLVDRSLQQTYDELFGEAVKVYNGKQKRADRRIDDYLQKIRSGKQEKPAYEFVVQIGNKDTNSALDEANRRGSSMIYRQFLERFEREFPNFRVHQAVVHQDEATPHLHVAYVPFSTGNKRGLETKNSLSGAMKQMGYTDVRDVNERLHSILQEVAAEHGIERLEMGCRRAHMNVRDYKAMVESLEEESDYPYRNDPALMKLLQEQELMLEDADEIIEEQKVIIEDLVADVLGAGRFSATKLKQVAEQAREQAEALEPKRDGLRGHRSRFKAAFENIPQWWRDNVIAPVSDALNRAAGVLDGISRTRIEAERREESSGGSYSLASMGAWARDAAQNGSAARHRSDYER